METYLTVKEVAAMVRLSEMTIRRYVMNKQIPFHKFVRAVRFKPSEIQKWIEEKKSGLVEDKEEAADLFDGAGERV